MRGKREPASWRGLDGLSAGGDRLDVGDLTSHDQRLDRVGALEGEDCLHVGEVPRYIMLEQDAVAAEDVPRVGDHRAGTRRAVELGH